MNKKLLPFFLAFALLIF